MRVANEPEAECAPAIFSRWVAAGRGSIESLCEAHPELAEELAELHAQWIDRLHAEQGARWIRARRQRNLGLRAFWLVPAGIAVLAASYVLHYAGDARRLETIDPEEVRSVLETDSRATFPDRDLVSYDDILETFNSFDWVGESPPRKVDDLSALIRIVSISDVVVVAYEPKAGLRGRPQLEGLNVGDHLRPPFDHVRVASIEKDGAFFEVGEVGHPDKKVWLPLKKD